MKKTKQIVGLILICVVSLFSCGEDKIEQVTTEVPEILSLNNEVTEYFAILDLFMEEYISMVESLVQTGKEVEESGGEPSLGDIISMTTDLTGSIMQMAPLLERLDKLEKEADILKGDMTSEELKAFMNTYTKIMIRIVEMGQKLQ